MTCDFDGNQEKNEQFNGAHCQALKLATLKLYQFRFIYNLHFPLLFIINKFLLFNKIAGRLFRKLNK